MSPLDPVLHFDEYGRLLKSFGAGMIVMPHGIYVDKDDNVWVTDNSDNAPDPEALRIRDDLKRTWSRETRLDRQEKGQEGTTPQLTGKYKK